MLGRRIVRVLVAFAASLASPIVHGADWPEWGGRAARNSVSNEVGLAASFQPGKKTSPQGIDLATTKNVRWVANLGSAAYGNPTVANGRVYVGTDDLTLEDDERFDRAGAAGLVKCLAEDSGKLLWQLVVPERGNLPPNVLFTHQRLGVCSSPTVENNRVYVVTCAAEVMCLDADGLADGNDGPYVEEGRYMAGAGQPPVRLADTDADIIWRCDLMDDLGVRPHDATSCSVLIHGDVLYTSTSNGVDKTHTYVLAPDAPAIVALDKRTGALVARETDGLSARLYHAQWSSPSLATVAGKTLVLFGGGDGVCYAFETLDAVPASPVSLKKVWSYDCNPPSYKYRDGERIPYYDGDRRKKNSPNHNDGLYVGPSQLIATPVFANNRVYIALGQDPAHGRGKGMLHCIDATRTGDVTQTGRVWTYDGLDRTIATATVRDGLVYLPDIAGRVHCLDADTGEPYWMQETKAETWGGVLAAEGRLYLGTQKDFFVLSAGKQRRVLEKIRLGSPAYMTPVVANGALYVASQHYLWAVRPDAATTSGS